MTSASIQSKESSDQDIYVGTPSPEWDEVRRLTREWLEERKQDELIR